MTAIGWLGIAGRGECGFFSAQITTLRPQAALRDVLSLGVNENEP
jgi:hypothetical protein